ncbi:phosphoribosylamine--glycine ligase [Treponema brennaborense]|uniref:Phosphoribosylamine--glycine ligase n=1 Tax=Treponema brennaborense (strain DSM 12168 / CIP 105900 / DD5/3) TaxID=906968 RepID=F4LNJ4_TREBD|nr:phosphoribosylamine--glycine ligase [Treponema brennaborense]AEE15848.1 Phosphoribosylamine--glycine ligase [Treponema brennaborense DSM 12168]
MKIMVIGSGGREHAICWTLAKSPSVTEIVCVPGNGGTAAESKCRNLDPAACAYLDGVSGTDIYPAIARHEGCTMAVVGPEDPLAAGVADELWNAGVPTVGPKSKGAALEASKDVAKQFMHAHRVACATSETFTDAEAARAYIKTHGAPIVVKADGLAAGKGVVVAATEADALNAVDEFMGKETLGAAGKKLVIEEYLQGVEISVLAAVSVTPESAKAGKACIVPFVTARDHKRLLDGAKGPNTGGMGAVAPVSDVTPEQMSAFDERILKPTLAGMIAENMDYRGFIFFGLMLTADGPKLLEYNVRLGDPETQAVLPLMDFDFAELCRAITNGTLKDFPCTWKPGFVCAPVAVSGGYPHAYKKGLPLRVTEKAKNAPDVKIFIAGAKTAENDGTGLVTSGGRVLAVSAYGETFEQARRAAYETMAGITFTDMFFRTDIGLPGAAESGAL